jgi:polyhydroxybutyrate depolymerase
MRAAAVLAALALAGCGSNGSGPKQTSTTAQRAACAPAGDIRVDAGTVLHVPPQRSPRPLLILAHPAGQTGPVMARFLDVSRRADREGYAVLFPSAARHHFWSLNRATRPDDLPRVRARLDLAERRTCVDPRRVYAAGVSNGGGFVARMACEMSDRIVATVSIAGSYKALDPCRADRPVSVLEIHGTGDTVVPYAQSAPGFIAAWAKRDHCGTTVARATPLRGVTHVAYQGCPPGVAVEHLRLAGTGHGWPGIIVIQGRDPTGLSATSEVFRFLRGRTLRAPG